MKRGLHAHPIFYQQPLRVAAWSWMVATAAYKDTRQNADGKTVAIKRGQLLTSYRQMSEATGVGIRVLRTLIDRLQAEYAISTATDTGRLLITISNYDKYQASVDKADTGKDTGPTQDRHTKETREQDTLEAKASNGVETPIKVSVSSSAVWNSGKPFLASLGVTNPGAVIGRWLKDKEPLEVLAAIDAAQKAGTQDPVPYITEALKGAGNGKRASKGEERMRAFIAGARGAS